MDVKRDIGQAPNTRQVARQLGNLKGPCIGCEACTGLCAALIELLTLPEAVRARP